MAAPVIKSGLDTTNPMSFAKTRQGYLVGVNGIDRGIFWDGRTEDSCSELGMDGPINPPTVLTPSTAQKPATTTVTVTSTTINGYVLNLTDGYGRTVAYYLVDTDTTEGTPTFNGRYKADNQCHVGLYGVDGSVTSIATYLKHAILGQNGHDGSILVEQSSGALTLTQLEGGTAGNTAVTEGATNAGSVTIADFTGGANTSRGSYATITAADGDAAHGLTKGQKINIVSTDGTSIDYVVSATNDSGAAHLSALTASSNIGGGTNPTITSGATAIAVGFDVSSGLTQNAFLVLLKAAIENLTNGHAGKIVVSAVPTEADDAQDIIVHQSAIGPSGDTTVTEDLATVSSTNFTNGTNVDGCTGGDYTCFYRYVDEREGVRFYSNLSPFQVVTAAADDTFLWKDLTPSDQSRVTHVQLLRTSFNQATTAYVVASLKHNGTFSVVTDSGTAVFTAPKGHGLVQGMRVVVSGSTNHNITWEVSSVASASTTADNVTMTTGIGSTQTAAMTWKLEGYTQDKLTDGQIVLFRGDYRQKLLQADGRPAANRHAPPPCFKSVCCAFQDRMTYLVDPEYSTGTITTEAGLQTVGGNGTGWSDHLVGRLLCPDPAFDKNTYLITGYTNSTTISVDKPLPALTTKNYRIINPPEERNTIYISEQDLPESVITQIGIQENVRDEDELVGAIVMGAQYYALKEHSIYRVTWAKNPLLDAQPQLAAMRGAINNRCADQHENTLYLMDEQGPYAFQGNAAQPIGAPISDFWKNSSDTVNGETLDFSKKDTWFVRVDPLEELAMFFVTVAGDTGSRPRTAFVYDIRGKTWTKWTYGFDVGDIVKLTYPSTGNRQRKLIMAATDAAFYVMNKGLTDGAASVSYSWKSGMFSWVESDQNTHRYFRVTFKPTTNTAVMNIKKYDNHSASPVAMNEWDGGDGVSIVQDATQAVADLKLSQHADGDEPGSKVLPWTGKLPLLRGRPVRWVSCEIAGSQSLDRIIVYEIEIGGVK